MTISSTLSRSEPFGAVRSRSEPDARTTASRGARRWVWSLATAGAALALAAGALSATPAHAIIGPHVKVEPSRAYNYADSYGQVQHYVVISKTTYKYAPVWAKPGNWSTDSRCWANVTSYSYNFKS